MRTEVVHSIDFGLEGAAQQFQLYGWSDPEDGYTWTDGKESGLLIPAFAAPHGFFVEIESNPPYIPTGRPFETVAVQVNGERRAVIRMTDRPHVHAIWVPPLPERERSVVITLSHPWCRRPVDFGHPGDTRRLGLAIVRLRTLRCMGPPVFLAGGRRLPVLTEQQSDADWHREVELAVGTPVHEFVLNFEMLAGNCEFGFVQRRCNADPLSLLRFSGGMVPQVIRGLDERFEGLCDGGDVSTEIADNPIAEWLVREKNYQLRHHTFQSSRTVTETDIIRTGQARLRFLRRLFLEDLEAPRKTYLFVDHDTSAPEEAVALFLALRRHGEHRLLWITTTGDPPGSVVEMMPGLMHGCIDRFAPTEDGGNVSMGGWLNLLVTAWTLHAPEGEWRNKEAVGLLPPFKRPDELAHTGTTAFAVMPGDSAHAH